MMKCDGRTTISSRNHPSAEDTSGALDVAYLMILVPSVSPVAGDVRGCNSVLWYLGTYVRTVWYAYIVNTAHFFALQPSWNRSGAHADSDFF